LIWSDAPAGKSALISTVIRSSAWGSAVRLLMISSAVERVRHLRRRGIHVNGAMKGSWFTWTAAGATTVSHDVGCETVNSRLGVSVGVGETLPNRTRNLESSIQARPHIVSLLRGSISSSVSSSCTLASPEFEPSYFPRVAVVRYRKKSLLGVLPRSFDNDMPAPEPRLPQRGR